MKVLWSRGKNCWTRFVLPQCAEVPRGRNLNKRTALWAIESQAGRGLKLTFFLNILVIRFWSSLANNLLGGKKDLAQLLWFSLQNHYLFWRILYHRIIQHFNIFLILVIKLTNSSEDSPDSGDGQETVEETAASLRVLPDVYLRWYHIHLHFNFTNLTNSAQNTLSHTGITCRHFISHFTQCPDWTSPWLVGELTS